MNSNELFSFFDQPRDEDMDVQEFDAMQVDTSKKRKAPSPVPTTVRNDELSFPEDEPAASSSKKQRMSSPKPVVVDEVEIEAKREVAASAGLTGSVEAGSRLELRHQVRNSERSVCVCLQKD
jgi:ATP-dependent RNA helicase DOB1